MARVVYSYQVECSIVVMTSVQVGQMLLGMTDVVLYDRWVVCGLQPSAVLILSSL